MSKTIIFLLLFLSGLVAVAQDYNEQFRPQIHFTPAQNWMNDPNGLVYHDGEYHLFYQHNPFGNTWGHMSWGHAVSSDLVHWEHLPVALEEENNIMIFSGSAVVDKQNTSGFGSSENPPMIAIYTGHHTGGPKELQDQRIAYSLDNGRTWTKYKGNPVIDEGMQHFRDPKVIWHEDTEQWIMVVALPDQHKVRFYGSENLKDWKRLSEFGPAGATKNVQFWECPDLFELPVEGNPNQTKWVLQVDVNPGAVAGGSGGQYFVGEFNGEKFVEDSQNKGQTLWADYGRDFYAVQSYSGIPEKDGRRIWIAWMNNWDYANNIPTSPWRSAMTVPREVGLVSTENGYRLTQEPVEELQHLRTDQTRFNGIVISNNKPKKLNFRDKTYELMVEIDAGDARTFGLNVRKGDNEKTSIGYDAENKKLYVDRTHSGEIAFDSTFAGRTSAPLALVNNRLTLHVIVDWSSVEVFGASGKISITNRIFPSPESNGIELFSVGGNAKIISMDVWKLESAWN